ncbi:hypothetical protein H0I39_16510 [Ottowia beijingensis]|uniref:Uncharacterized protein n=1 Tax=Ottowia beijingensis TaxID=1207057 RepID=A0A853IWP7_9BURK|nr:hypothetical protein [Ottowia beijingensis]NZA02934.1 hypothetical protein [Ottowia beijingensis]
MPAVVYAVGRTRALAVWLTALSAGGLLMLVSVFLASSRRPHSASSYLFIGFSTAAMLGCWHFWRGQVPRRLRWDGERWWVIDSHGEQEGAQVQVRLDAQRWMLLWFRPVGSSRGGGCGPRPRSTRSAGTCCAVRYIHP